MVRSSLYLRPFLFPEFSPHRFACLTPVCPQYTQLGIMTKGTIIEVNVSELGLVTTGGKVVWGKYAQITNDPVRFALFSPVLPTYRG